MVAAITKRHDVPLTVYQTTLLHVASVEVLPRDFFFHNQDTYTRCWDQLNSQKYLPSTVTKNRMGTVDSD